jgi:hypothetical protein
MQLAALKRGFAPLNLRSSTAEAVRRSSSRRDFALLNRNARPLKADARFAEALGFARAEDFSFAAAEISTRVLINRSRC